MMLNSTIVAVSVTAGKILLSLLDVAKMDGCRPLRYLFQILVPLAKNSIGVLTVIPPLLVFFFMQESFMKGFAVASEK